MSVDHLDVLHEQLPELFQPRDLSPAWDEDLIIVPIDDPEWTGGDADIQASEPLNVRDRIRRPFEELENAEMGPISSAMEVPSFSPVIINVLGGAHAGAPIPRTDPTKMPPPDCLAFYLPFHYYHPTWWGIYILFEGVAWLAGEIFRRSHGKVPWTDTMRAARLFLYHHEAFHHKTECFATRLEMTHRRPFYKTGFERYYQSTAGQPACLEEGLSNASALQNVNKKLKDGAIDKALEGYVVDSPPGYSRGVEIRSDMMKVRCQFAEDNQRICLPQLPNKSSEVWRAAPHMFNGISDIKGRVNYVIPRNSPLLARTRFRPLLPPDKLVKKLQNLAQLQFIRHGANHDVYRAQNGKNIILPRHQRDLGHGLVRSILKQAGLSIGLEAFLES